jgi:hypothetical protein
MSLFNSILDFAKSLDPLVLIVGGLLVLFVLFLLVRFATGLVVRILTLGCGVIVLIVFIWAVFNFIF